MATSETHGAAVRPSPVHHLSVSAAFESLSEQERFYAHHLSRFVSKPDQIYVCLPLLTSRSKGLPGMVHESFCARRHLKQRIFST